MILLFKRHFEGVDNLGNHENSEATENPNYSRIAKALSMVDNWVSNPLDRESLVKELRSMRIRDLMICKDKLEDILKKDVINLLFGCDNIEQLKKKTIKIGDIEAYPSHYIGNTDFGYGLTGKNISIEKRGNASIGLEKKILLSVGSRVDMSNTDGMVVNIPFNQQYGRQSSYYKPDNLSIEYFGKNDRKECIVRLVDFVQKIKDSLKNVSGNRQLGIFGDMTEHYLK